VIDLLSDEEVHQLDAIMERLLQRLDPTNTLRILP
jgi:hypothetical protein